MDDRELAARQLRDLAVLDEAHRALSGTGVGCGAVFLLIGLAFPAMKLLATIAHAAMPGPGFIQRMADIPTWVVVLMMVCGGGIGLYALVTGWKQRGASAPTIAHLRAHPDDPIVAVQSQAHVQRGYRTVHHWLTSKRGAQTHEVVPASHEKRVEQALATAIPQARG